MQIAGLKGSRLSLQQTRLWSLQSEPQTYRVQCSVLLEGPLHSSLLKQALQQIVAQHEILHTVFQRLPEIDLPVQVVAEQPDFDYEESLFEGLDTVQQSERISQMYAEEQGCLFDFARGPLLHVRLLRLRSQKHVLLISLPALCADLATLRILINQLSQTYAALLEQKAIAEDPLQYADVAVWQQELLQDDDAQEYLASWQRATGSLAGQAVPFLPHGQLNLEARKEIFSPLDLPIELDGDLGERLFDLAQQYSVSCREVLLACWQVLLWRFGGGAQVQLGCLCNGRYYDDLSQALGAYSRTVPLPGIALGEKTFAWLLQQVRTDLEDALENQYHFNWPQIGEQQSAKFFPLSFAYEEWPRQWETDSLNWQVLQQNSCLDRFLLHLSVDQRGQQLQLQLSYDASLFSQAQVSRLARGLLCLIQAVVKQPEQRIAYLPVLKATEQQELLAMFSGDAPAENISLLDCFERYTADHPGQPALCFNETQLSYGQLGRLTNQLARWLKRAGVGRDVPVGLYLERGVEMVIGMLGVLKAGGAYVPLDPAWPVERLTQVLAETGALVVLTRSDLHKHLPGEVGVVQELDEWSWLEGEEKGELAKEDERESLAYILYTSGSTGQPKGVAVRRESLYQYVAAIRNVLGVEDGWQYATVSTLAADLGNTVIYGALSSGGCLHVLPYETATQGELLAGYMQSHRIDVLKIVPSHLRTMLQSAESGAQLLPRRHLILGGEALTQELLRLLVPTASECEVWNHYGPTETTVGVLLQRIGTVNHLDLQSIQIALGKAIGSNRVYIADEHQQVVPVGVIGELCVAGQGLARGYLKRAGQTAEKFVPDPYGQPGERAYHTGDLARYGEAGEIEFIGRKDRQVKVRGYRVELGEIEALLQGHEQVREALVVMRGERIIGYVIERQPLESTQELRAWLRERLPEYMVPATLVRLRTWPLTENGKIDLRGLPDEDRAEERIIVAPRTPIEELLLQVWQAVLGVQTISIHDNFVALGGHSLLATQAVSRIRAALRVEIPLRALFEAPTIAGLAQIVEKIVHQGMGIDYPPFVSRSQEQDIPLSFAQQRLWIIDQMASGGSAYNIPLAVHMRGPLQKDALAYSLREVVRRHESLRTTFVMHGEQPVQRIHPVEQMFDLRFRDLHLFDPTEREKQVRQWMLQESEQTFDLSSGPLFRACLLMLSEDEHLLLWTMHHIVSDGWSGSILLREVSHLYNAFVQGQPSSLSPLQVQYADYAIWQRQWLRGTVLQRQEEYWRQQLAGISPLELPTDYPRPPEQTTRGAAHALRLPVELSQELRALSQREGVTPFMLLLAAFQVLLARYSGQEDIVVGTPIANRTQAEIEGLIGFFVNTLALRTNLSGKPSFRDVLRCVREGCLGAYAHQDLPFEYLVERLQPERDRSRHPLFQVLFIMQQEGAEVESLVGLEVDALQMEVRQVKFDLALTVLESAQGMHCLLEYRTDLFEPETIARLAGHWQTLLEGIATEPATAIGQLRLLSEQERDQQVHGWNRTRQEVPAAASIHALVEQQAARTPQGLAVYSDGLDLNYEQLNQQSNLLARRLQRKGIGPEHVVGVYLERSASLVIGLLGVLKAGGAYLPLEPGYPWERLKYEVEDAGASVVLTRRDLSEQVVSLGLPIVCLEEWEEETGESAPVSKVQAENLAYVIYTSGSTGQPKGVGVTHQNMLNLLAWYTRHYQLTAADRVTQLFSFGFDPLGQDLWPTLMTGASVWIVDEETRLVPERLQAWLIAHQITMCNAPTPLTEGLLALEWPREGILRHLGAGGERLRGYPGPGVPWILQNFYGPAECTIMATAGSVPERCNEHDRVPGIGRPIGGVEVYVLDGLQELVPTGVVGEMFIGGAGVARGYMKQGGMTAERFVPDSWSGRAGGRLYRTGDLARYREDGSLEYVGRKDQQVKVRGYRIELGEIETVLGQHVDIRECVVQAREGRLVAYVVINQGVPETKIGVWQAYLGEKLPAYMVPGRFVFLAALPLTANGKIDYKALPEPEEEAGVIGIEEQPRGVVEEAVAEIWSGLLERERIGRQESFFALGGHSLLATQVIARIRGLFRIDISLRELFENPTIAGLAACIEQALRGEEVETPLPPLVPVSREEALPLSFAQQRLWFLAQLDPQSAAYNLFHALRLRGPLRRDVLEACFLELLTRHEVLRTTFGLHEGQPVQQIHPARGPVVQYEDLTHLSPAQQEQEIHWQFDEEAQAPFDLMEGPLLRVKLLGLRDQEHLLLLAMHHIVSDGWSSTILVQEFNALYAAYLQGQTSPLPALPIQYADYAVWQRGWLRGERLQRQEDYWREQLAGIAPLQLPTDRLRPPEQTTRGAWQTIQVPEELRQLLRELAQQEGVTQFMLLLAAFQVLLGRYSGQEDIVVGTPVANRTQAETEGLTGFFINTLALRTDLSGSPSFREVLRRVREVSLGAYAHQDLPFEYLVERLQPERDRSRHPLFQVIFRVEQDGKLTGGLKGLEMEGLAMERQINFDLILVMHVGNKTMHSELKYNADLFDEATIERLLRHWNSLLWGVVKEPDATIQHLPLLSEQEWEQQAREWNRTELEIAEQIGIHQLIERQAALNPQGLAVRDGGRELSYGELNQRANRLARRLRKQGIGPERVVGVYIERSEGLVVGLLAVLKAGGAYLPLEPGLPEERLAYELADAGAAVVLTQHKLQEQVASFGISVVCLEEWEEEAEASNLESSVLMESLAYIIYTSGSTGMPKGVGITHLALHNLVCWHQKAFALACTDRASHLAGLGFDASGWELWPYLASGACVCPVDDQTRLSPELLQEWLLREKITVSFLPTPLAEKMLVLDWPSTTILRLVLTGGDRLHQLAVSALPFGVINNYGPTEYTVVGTSSQVFADERTGTSPSIGRPIANTQVYLLDVHFQPVPVGVSGELYLGGSGVARGYIHRPALTAEKFIPDPFSLKPGQRLYRTGDLASYRMGGLLEYVGRRDQQVKIRGYRIELGEIEAILGQHPDVSECVVQTEEDTLIAYVVTRQAGQKMGTGVWRTYLEEKLPAYMVPGRFVQLAALPLTANGKIDRDALVELEEEEKEEGMQEQLNGAMEEAIAEIWSKLLERKKPGRQESFFELGGHSLLAMQVMTRVRSLFGVEISLRKLFEEPTIAGLGRRVREALAGEEQEARPLLAAVGRDQDLPLSFAQQRLWLLDQMNLSKSAYNIPLAVRLTGNLDIPALEYTLQEIVRRHEVLRTTFSVDKNQQPVQTIHEADVFSLKLEDVGQLSANERSAAIKRIATGEADQPFDLSQGPLLRARLLRLDEHEYILLLTMHHIVFDGWSGNILTREIIAIYKASVQGKKHSLRPLPLQYADFAWWQRQYVQSQAFLTHLEYWKRQLQDAHALDLPTDRLRSEQRNYQAASYVFLVPGDIVQELNRYSQKQNATLFMVLLTAFQVLLYRVTGIQDVVVGTDIANRMYEETESLIGFFVNLLALRAQFNGQSLFHEVLLQVREVVLNAYAHQDVPFDLLVEKLHLERGTGINPLVNVLFVLQNTPDGGSDVELPELVVGAFDAPVSLGAKFDLALFFSEGVKGLRGAINYSSELFDEATIVSLARQYELLLRNMLVHPDVPIDALALITTEEKEQKQQINEKRRSILEKSIRNSKGERLRLSNFEQ